MSVSFTHTTILTDPSEPFLINTVEDYQTVSTEEEYNTIIKPFNEWLPTFNGFISHTITVTDALSRVSQYTFDTHENSLIFYREITRAFDTQNPLAAAKIQWETAKELEHGTVAEHSIISFIDDVTQDILWYGTYAEDYL